MTSDTQYSDSIDDLDGTLFVEEPRFAIVPEWVIDAAVTDAAFRLYSLLLQLRQRLRLPYAVPAHPRQGDCAARSTPLTGPCASSPRRGSSGSSTDAAGSSSCPTATTCAPPSLRHHRSRGVAA